VDIAVPGSGRLDDLERDRLDLKLRAAKLRRDEADLDLSRVTEVVKMATQKAAKR
jgi:hypothetical protein